MTSVKRLLKLCPNPDQTRCRRFQTFIMLGNSNIYSLQIYKLKALLKMPNLDGLVREGGIFK